jgi:tetratricopeptide (TPR) repeat protein
MRPWIWIGWMLVPAFLGSAARHDAARWLLEGDEAYERGDYSSAADAYSNAELRTNDPGLVAFNKAAALYRLGRYGEAESYYERSLEDAGDDRLPQALYNLANCLVHQAGDTDAGILERAIANYERCLRLEPKDSGLAEDARANLELTRALLARAKANRASRPDSESAASGAPKEVEDAGRAAGSAEPGARPHNADGARRIPLSKDGGEEPMPADQAPPPGKGNLPPIPDRDKILPLSPEETAAYLKKAAERIAEERREHHKRSTHPSSSSLLDW